MAKSVKSLTGQSFFLSFGGVVGEGEGWAEGGNSLKLGLNFPAGSKAIIIIDFHNGAFLMLLHLFI